MSKLNLAEMAEGAFMERANQELKRAIENIADPNTDPKKARRVTLSITLKGDEKRDVVDFEVQSKFSPISARPIVTKVIIDRDRDGSVVGAELKSGQKGQMYFDQEGIKDDKGSKVVSIQR